MLQSITVKSIPIMSKPIKSFPVCSIGTAVVFPGTLYDFEDGVDYLFEDGEAFEFNEASAPPATCDYTFDPNSGFIFGASDYPTVSVPLQSYGFSVAAGTQTFGITNTTAEVPVSLAGVMAFEYLVTGPATLPTNNQDTSILLTTDAPAFAAEVYLRYRSVGARIDYNATTLTALTTPVSSTIGVYIDASTGKIGVTVDGVDFGYQADAPFSTASGFAISGLTGSIGDAGYAGNSFSFQLITDMSSSVQPFPAGATDLCGNVI